MKSKEALERLVKQANARKLSNEIVVNRWDYEKLLELVERDTPIQVFDMGVDNRGTIRTFICPVCHQWLTLTEKENFCPKCGQRLDWEE